MEKNLYTSSRDLLGSIARLSDLSNCFIDKSILCLVIAIPASKPPVLVISCIHCLINPSLFVIILFASSGLPASYRVL